MSLNPMDVLITCVTVPVEVHHVRLVFCSVNIHGTVREDKCLIFDCVSMFQCQQGGSS